MKTIDQHQTITATGSIITTSEMILSAEESKEIETSFIEDGFEKEISFDSYRNNEVITLTKKETINHFEYFTKFEIRKNISTLKYRATEMTIRF